MALLPARPGPRTDASTGDRQWRINYPGGVRANTTALDPVAFLWDVTLAEIFDLWEEFGEETLNHVDDDWAEGLVTHFEDPELEEDDYSPEQDFFAEREDDGGYQWNKRGGSTLDNEPQSENVRESEIGDPDDIAMDELHTSGGLNLDSGEEGGNYGSVEGAEPFIPTEEWMMQFWDMPRAANYSWTRIACLVAGAVVVIALTGHLRRKWRGLPGPNLDPGADPEVGKKVLRKSRTRRGPRGRPPPREEEDEAAGVGGGVPAAAGGTQRGDSVNGPKYMAALRGARKAMAARRFLLAENALRRLVRRLDDDEADLSYRAPAYRSLAVALLGQEKWEAAMGVLNDFLRLVRRVAGETPKEVILPDLLKLCICETHLNHIEEASKLLSEIEATMPSATERQREDMKMDLLVVSALLAARAGRLDEAEAKSRLAAAAAADAQGDISPVTWRLRTDHAVVLLDCGKPELAEPLLDDVVNNVVSFARAQKLPLVARLAFVHRVATAEFLRERYERAEHFLQRAMLVLEGEPDALKTRLGKELQRMVWNDQAAVQREKQALHSAAGNADKANACTALATMLEAKVQEGAEADQTSAPLTFSRLLHSIEAYVPVADRCASVTLGLQSARPLGLHPQYRIAAGSSLRMQVLDVKDVKEAPLGRVLCETQPCPLVPPDFAEGRVVLRSPELAGVPEGAVLLAIVSVLDPSGQVVGTHRQFLAVSADSAQLRRALAD